MTDLTDVSHMSRPSQSRPPAATADECPRRTTGARHAYRDDGASESTSEALRREMELLFYAYRNLIAEPDRLLAGYGFGRAHHRVLHFIRRNPGIAVAELLPVLRITKQSLARVLRKLVNRGLVAQQTDAKDRRRRRLYLTPAGQALEKLVSAPQRARLAAAFQAAGPTATDGWRAVLWALLDDADRTNLVAARGPPTTGDEVRWPGSAR